MLHKYASDSHSHTTFSPDGTDSPRAMCEKAREIELYYYTVTDHVELNGYIGDEADFTGFKDKPNFNFKINSEKSLEELKRLQGEFNDAPKVLKGVELGQCMQNLPAAEEVAARDYDFILASVHNVGGFQDFYWLDYEKTDRSYIDNLISKYFAELLDTVKWGKFDSLSHLTYPVRYIRIPGGEVYSLDGHMDEIKTLLEAVIKNKKAIELNTSGLYNSSPQRTTQPPQELLNLYRQMGGKYITIGSDSHRASDLGKGIDEGLDMIKQAGFDEFTVYVNREPVLIPIE